MSELTAILTNLDQGKYLDNGGVPKAKKDILQLIDYIIGKDTIDLSSKYEEYDGDEGLFTEFNDDDSDEIIGEKLALLANFVADKTSNELRDEQRQRAGL